MAEHVVLLKFVFSCFHFCSVHVQQLSHWRMYRRWAMDHLFGYQLGHMLEKVEKL